MNNWRIFFLVALACIVLGIAYSSAVAAEKKIYRWVDKYGKVHYSDKKPPDEKAEEANDLPKLLDYKQTKIESASKRKTKVKYQSLSITSPGTIVTRKLDKLNEGLTISVSVSPMLMPSDLVRIKLNGKVVSRSQSTSYRLPSIALGKHKIEASVFNKHGHMLIKAKPLKFEVNLSEDLEGLRLDKINEQ